MSWQHRLTRIREACTDLFGRQGWRWRVIRTSNAYVFRDPQLQPAGVPASKFRNRVGTLNQEIQSSIPAPASDPDRPLERALARFGAAVAAKDRIEQAAGS